jgi:ribosome-associated protein
MIRKRPFITDSSVDPTLHAISGDSAATTTDNRPDRPSKSQLKREMAARQMLGKEIVELSKEALKKIVLPEALEAAAWEARRITNSHEGYRRQLQYIGRLMRQLEPGEVAALRQTLQAIKSASHHETGHLHAIERWREQLLEQEEALTEFIRRYPHTNAQEGRTLIRLARREAEQKKPPRYFRELFQWIKQSLEQADETD